MELHAAGSAPLMLISARLIVLTVRSLPQLLGSVPVMPLC
ncbi:hypothetical protein, unknown function [Leishmania tarentolae]|uniref:Uncharacterized protein n=1 Tax=Leishmania tarentolae TaxID=5689 RepID=A0A640KYB0_LEITA|nr:hypothetical protein, unknown function [Leishmania tarentolae]GET93995.1 hypothetical protein, unknown function [Leishmania tarentolae]